ncbi:MAG: hypothetical protein ACAH80_08725 [Alphaproteobacteria bacterium]
MDQAHFLLALLFFLTIGHLVTLKLCSVKLDHRTAPLFISIWTLLGAAAVSPHYGHLWIKGWDKFVEAPWLLALVTVKGLALCYLFVVSQQLMKVSLSSRHYVTPLAVGLITVSNSFFGEKLKFHEMFAGLGLCALAAAFFFKGHLSSLDRPSRIAYAKLVLLSTLLSTTDLVLTKATNWYALVILTYAVVFVVACIWNFRAPENFKAALFHRSAAMAGVLYAATELVKFYQQVEINPVSVVVTVQAMTKPVILVLSALIWKERTVREQLVWGLAAFVITLPLFIPQDVLEQLLPFLKEDGVVSAP